MFIPFFLITVVKREEPQKDEGLTLPSYLSPCSANRLGAHLMSATQFLPLSPELFALACSTVSRRVSQLPFLQGGVNVTGELLGVAMESLNAEPSRALALTTPRDTRGNGTDGLDIYLEQHLGMPGGRLVPVIADVMCSAGITERTEILDRQLRRPRKAIRLLSPWTWHIGSTMAPSVRFGGSGDGAGPSLSWLDVCPVCRTGILERVVGKQLFGIPRTDFYIECSFCGAKYIPVGLAFRLVAITTVRDPIWKKHLDKTNSPEEWSAIARGTNQKGSTILSRVTKKPAVLTLPAAAITLSSLKDGSLGLPLSGKTLYFHPVTLRYVGGVREEVFARVQKTLAELMELPAFEHLRSRVNLKYSRYLPMKTGFFLGQLKERHDPFYREFLNPFGDEKYGTFRAEDSRKTEKKGILIAVVNRGLYHAFNSSDALCRTINTLIGRIGPDDCLLSGDPARCMMNTLLCTSKKEAGLYIHPVEQGEERLAIIRAIDDIITVR
jgi:hypothetical protein